MVASYCKVTLTVAAESLCSSRTSQASTVPVADMNAVHPMRLSLPDSVAPMDAMQGLGLGAQPAMCCSSALPQPLSVPLHGLSLLKTGKNKSKLLTDARHHRGHHWAQFYVAHCCRQAVYKVPQKSNPVPKQGQGNKRSSCYCKRHHKVNTSHTSSSTDA